MKSSVRRSKLVRVRLSPDELPPVPKACDAKGFRSVSDLARTAMHKLVAAEDHADPLTYEVEDLRNQAHFFALELGRISETISARNAVKA
jgi:hypothetical protein